MTDGDLMETAGIGSAYSVFRKSPVSTGAYGVGEEA